MTLYEVNTHSIKSVQITEDEKEKRFLVHIKFHDGKSVGIGGSLIEEKQVKNFRRKFLFTHFTYLFLGIVLFGFSFLDLKFGERWNAGFTLALSFHIMLASSLELVKHFQDRKNHSG